MRQSETNFKAALVSVQCHFASVLENPESLGESLANYVQHYNETVDILGPSAKLDAMKVCEAPNACAVQESKDKFLAEVAIHVYTFLHSYGEVPFVYRIRVLCTTLHARLDSPYWDAVAASVRRAGLYAWGRT